MAKNILITGSTDGIGLEAAKTLRTQGHHILLHGRNASKLKAVQKALSELAGTGRVDGYLADLSSMVEVEKPGETIAKQHSCLDVVINNAGVFRINCCINIRTCI